jgi:hypothetical protein
VDWGARLKAAWRGEVSGADLGAMFAATASLSGVQQALADRRLAAEIEHAGHDWRTLLAVGPIAAPLWLADALVGLAGAFYDTETQSHPDRPTAVSPYTHDLVAGLLSPVEDIIADVAAALADPDHRASLTVPMHLAPASNGDIGTLPNPVPALYARGLATGARRIHTSAASALSEAQQTVAKSPSPDWLTAGLQRLNGEVQSAGARLDMDEVRLAPLAGERAGDASALAAVCRDLWNIVDTAVVVGQMASDPHLLPEAASASAHPATGATPSRTPTAPPPRQPTHEVHEVRAAPLPRIAEGAPSPGDSSESALAPRPTAAPAAPDVSLPAVGDAPAAAPPEHTLPAVEQRADIPLPVVGEAPLSPPASPPAANPTLAPAQSHPDASRRPSSAASGNDDEPLVRFPDIG